MKNIKTFYFFQCLKCKNWLYTVGRVKNKKCTHCRKNNSFDVVKKHKYEITSEEAIKVIQEFKKRDYDQIIKKGRITSRKDHKT